MKNFIQGLKQGLFFMLLIICIVLLCQARCKAQTFPDSLKSNIVKLDYQYSKKHQLFVVGPYYQRDEVIYEEQLNKQFYKPWKDIWENNEWWISKQCSELGCYYLFKLKS